MAIGAGAIALAFAVKNGQPNLIELILARGAAVNTVGARTGKPLLHETALRGYSHLPAVADLLTLTGLQRDVLRPGKLFLDA